MSENANPTGDHGHGHAEAEPDNTNVALLGFFLAVTTAVVVTAVWALNVWFDRQNEALKQEQIYSVPNPELDQLRQQEKDALEKGGVIDANAGIYRVPVSRGMELFVAEARARARDGIPQRIGPVPPPPTAAPAAPGAAPAPGTAPAPAPAPAPAATK